MPWPGPPLLTCGVPRWVLPVVGLDESKMMHVFEFNGKRSDSQATLTPVLGHVPPLTIWPASSMLPSSARS